MSVREKKLPKGWKWVKLGEVMSLVRGVTYSRSSEVSEGGHQILRAHNISLSGEINFDNIRYIDKSVKVKKEQRLKANDIFICLASGSKSHVGKVAFVKKDLDYYFGGFMGAIRSNSDDVFEKYIYYLLLNNDFNQYILLVTGAVNINNLSGKVLGDYKIPLPPLAEQKRIVAALDKRLAAVEKARQSAEKVLADAKQLSTALLREVFPAGEKLPKGWKWVALGDIIQINFGVRITRKNDSGTEYPVYGGGGESFRTDSFNRENEYVISRFAMSAKCVRYVAEKFFLLDSGMTFSLRDKANDKDYVGHFLFTVQEYAYSTARGQAQKNLDVDKFLQIKICLPPLADQKRIVAKLDKQLAAAEKARQAAEQQLAEINLLSAAILRETLTP